MGTDIMGRQGTARISCDALQLLLEQVFRNAGASWRVAQVLAANCVACERDGSKSHGVFRIPGYLSSIGSQWVDATAEPRIEQVGTTFLRVDAANGFAQPALAAASPILVEMARQHGVALLAIRNSHHFSSLWPDVEPFARDGLLALGMVNSFACTIGFDGKSAVFGTNPLAFAAPREGGDPIVADLSTSAIANGDVQIAARQGSSIEEKVGVDRLGRPTIDPNAILDGGALLTFGGYKGSAVSMMIELFVAALSGGRFSFEVDWSGHPGAQTPLTGQVVILIDPDHGRAPSFARRAEILTRKLYSSGVSRLPGDRRMRQRQRSLSEGIELDRTEMEYLTRMAAKTGSETLSA
ncbi:Ldh family oxidoreductase [Acetobacteraceae bacterium KSS8]|uniref:Ldh family oxidoreductase n=1 Tax=Endosaccharibacter trunci TaxID=2812733 RepID=A0ABT1W7Q7_9PROT|nr:Ldh family oxidoreductase [Acetobacteraceae bacterium KSS8]